MHEIKNLIIKKGILLTEDGEYKVFPSYEGLCCEAIMTLEPSLASPCQFRLMMSWNIGSSGMWLNVYKYDKKSYTHNYSNRGPAKSWSEEYDSMIFSSTCSMADGDTPCGTYHGIMGNLPEYLEYLQKDLQSNDYHWKTKGKFSFSQNELFAPIKEVLESCESWRKANL